VKRLKAILDDSSSETDKVLTALSQLQSLGSLPTKVLSDTLVGKAVNQVAKATADEAVKAKAKELVDGWRQAHRKRKGSSGDLGSLPSLKRSQSSTASLEAQMSQPDLEGGQGSPRSQETLGSVPSPREQPEVPKLERMESRSSMTSEAGDGKEKDYRVKVRAKLLEALGSAEELETRGGNSVDQDQEMMRDPAILASEIEEALNEVLPKKETYMNQARSILYNLKDPKNLTFRFKLMMGFYTPAQVPTMKSEAMASDEKNAERAKQRKFAMEEIQSDWALKNGQQRITGMFTCGKCKGVRTTYFQMQTRSSDEPMTTFVSCLTCNNRWKFC